MRLVIKGIVNPQLLIKNKALLKAKLVLERIQLTYTSFIIGQVEISACIQVNF